jgi:hypothetical protein
MNKKLIVFVFLTIFFVFFNVQTYSSILRNKNYDAYSFMATVVSLENYAKGSSNITFFPDALINTPHTNFFTFDILILKMITGIDLLEIIYLIAFFSLILFLFSSYLFINKIMKNRKKTLVSIILILTIFQYEVTTQSISAGLYNLADLTLRAFSYQIIGVSFLFLSLYFIWNYFEEDKLRYLFLFLLSSLFLFNLHLQIFLVSLTAILFILLEFKLIKTKKFYKKIILPLAILFIICLIGLIWPFYNWFSLSTTTFSEFQKGLIASGDLSFDVNHPSYYFNLLSVSIIGVIFLFREKNKFIKYWLIFMIGIIIISLLGFKIPLFYRFALFIKLMLIILIIKNLNITNKKRYVFLLCLILLIGVLPMHQNIDISISRNNDLLLYDSIKKLNITGEIILSDPKTSNLIQSTDNRVLFIPQGHIGNPNLLIVNDNHIKNYSLEISINLYDFIKRKNISYIIVDKSLNPPFINLEQLNKVRKELTYEDQFYEIFKLEK